MATSDYNINFYESASLDYATIGTVSTAAYGSPDPQWGHIDIGGYYIMDDVLPIKNIWNGGERVKKLTEGELK